MDATRRAGMAKARHGVARREVLRRACLCGQGRATQRNLVGAAEFALDIARNHLHRNQVALKRRGRLDVVFVHVERFDERGGHLRVDFFLTRHWTDPPTKTLLIVASPRPVPIRRGRSRYPDTAPRLRPPSTVSTCPVRY